MNRFTFFMQPASHYFNEFANQEGRPAWYSEVDEIYLLRWETKHSRKTAMRNVKAIVVDHLKQRIANGELTIMELYKPHFAVSHSDRWKYIAEWCKADTRGFPKIVRLEQPEKSK